MVPQVSPSSDQNRRCVSRLTDKCNALARRLGDVEKQILPDLVDGEVISPLRSAGHGGTDPRGSPRAGTLKPPMNSADSLLVSRGQDATTPGGGEMYSTDVSEHNRDSPFRVFIPSGFLASPCASPWKSSPGLPSPGRRATSVGLDVLKPTEQPRARSRRGGGDDEGEDQCARIEDEITTRFGAVAEGLAKLSNVFTGAEEILQRRVRAITIISRWGQSTVQGWCPGQHPIVSPRGGSQAPQELLTRDGAYESKSGQARRLHRGRTKPIMGEFAAHT